MSFRPPCISMATICFYFIVIEFSLWNNIFYYECFLETFELDNSRAPHPPLVLQRHLCRETNSSFRTQLTKQIMTFLCEIAKIESVDPSCHDRTILNFSVICNQFVTHEELNGIRLTVVFAYHAIYLSRLSMLMFPNWRQTARQRASK